MENNKIPFIFLNKSPLIRNKKKKKKKKKLNLTQF